jgi:predicted permease
MQDFRYALRMLRKNPGFAFTAVLTLALGIGASTAVFTLVDSIVLEPLAYRGGGSLVVAWERIKFLGSEPTGPNPRHADLWRQRATSFSGLTLLRHGAGGLSLGTDHPQLVGTVSSLPNLFEVLQAAPLLGRTFLPDDGVKGHDHVAILTYALWQTSFLGDTNVIGKTIRLADTLREVIGVLPPNFHFPNKNSLRAFRSKQPASSVPEPAVFIPAVMNLNEFSWNGEYGNWVAVARLKPGVGIRQAAAQLSTIEAQIVRETPAGSRNDPDALLTSLQPMQEAVVGDSKTGLLFLMAAVIGLMLIACVNLANAQVGRTLSRQRDAAVRAALGAGKWRLVWNSLAENLVLAAAGGVAGVILAAGALNYFRRHAPVDLPRLSEVHLDLTVLLFSAILTVGSSVLFGVLPALRLLRTNPQESLQQGSSRTLGSRQSRRLRSLLIGLQVFGCTVLLLVTGLFAKSLLNLTQQEKGFETGHVAVAEVTLSGKSFSQDQSRIAFNGAVLQNLRAIPGVQTASMVSAMPLEGESWIEGIQRVDRPDREAPLINLRWVSPGYFETMREKLLAGRFFEERDRDLRSVVLSEGEAKALWPDENPVGGQVNVQGKQHHTVIGVVADSHTTSLKSEPSKMAYLHYNERPPYSSFFMARGSQSGAELVSSMRQAIWKHLPDVTIARVKSLDSQLADSLATERFHALVLMTFGTAALLLAMLGIYGVLSYSTVIRKQEIGVRMALGATRREIYSLTLGEAGTPVFTGLLAGVAASVLAGRVIQRLLFGIRTVDLSVTLIVAALFLAAALAAGFLPARRAASVDPMDALRAD